MTPLIGVFIGAILSVPLIWAIERHSKRRFAREDAERTAIEAYNGRAHELARHNRKRPPPDVITRRRW